MEVVELIVLISLGAGVLFLAIRSIGSVTKEAQSIRSSSYTRTTSDSSSPNIKVKQKAATTNSPAPIVKITDIATEESSLEKWKASLQLISKGMGEAIEFTYQSSDGERSRRIMNLDAILKSSQGHIYLSGYCHTEKEDRTFNIDSIATMVKHKSKRYEVYEYLDEKYGLDAY